MGLLDFQKLPVNTLIGADRKTFGKITAGKNVDKIYRTKYRLTRYTCLLMNLLYGIQEKRYRKTGPATFPAEAPVFILGHWRSGTTFVHNVLARDPQFGYTTTYQTVFPHLVLWGQPFFKKTMSWLMPGKRPTDNMELDVDLPQEEEFALSNMMPYSYYNFWFFPRHIREYCDKYLLMEKASETEKRVFKETFLKLVNLSLHNTGGKRYLSKNPPHTGRIPQLLELFPDARFIYLMRNPYTVFESTRSFFTNTIRSLQLQTISTEDLQEAILEVYVRLYRKYQADKKQIPPGRLIEIKFEDFEADALNMTEKIYRTLDLPGLETALPAIRSYLEKKKGYRKNSYTYAPRTLETVKKHWGIALEDWGYR